MRATTSTSIRSSVRNLIVGVYTRTPNAARDVLARHEHPNPHVNGEIRVAVGNVLIEDGKHGLEDPNRPKKNVYSRLGAIGASIALLAGLITFTVGVVYATSGPETDSTASGQITSVGQREYSNRSRRSGSSSRGCRASATFQVDGSTFSASTHEPDDAMCWKSAGDDITVHYAAADPSTNYIGDRPGKGASWPIAIGLTLSAVGGLLAAARINSMRLGRTLVSEGGRMMRTHPDPGDGTAYARAAATEMDLVLRGATADTPTPAEAAAPEAPASVAPGWYPTADGAHVRWHDGTGWTDHTQPVPDHS